MWTSTDHPRTLFTEQAAHSHSLLHSYGVGETLKLLKMSLRGSENNILALSLQLVFVF